jgi:hypothetical protein
MSGATTCDDGGDNASTIWDRDGETYGRSEPVVYIYERHEPLGHETVETLIEPCRTGGLHCMDKICRSLGDHRDATTYSRRLAGPNHGRA